MPLYMDIHFVGAASLEDTRKAHLQDLAVQEKYGVVYHQYWFNKEAGTVYCLMEGPDKESCAATHREANGLAACQIVEVEGGIYDLFMGGNQKIDHGLVRHNDGKIDTGYRYILTLNIVTRTNGLDQIDFDQLILPEGPKTTALLIINENGGKEVRTGCFGSIIAVFETPDRALKSAHEVQKEFSELTSSPVNDNILFSIGISVGQPLTEKGGFFETAIRMSQRMCLIAGEKEIIASRLFEELCESNEVVKKHVGLRTIKPSDEDFIDNLLDITDNRFSDNDFGVRSLSKEIGISTPQLYRKVTAITGRSPVSFIRDIRLHKALSLIKENKLNISEIALEVGYNNPSYFSKCFQEKFGINPSGIAI